MKIKSCHYNHKRRLNSSWGPNSSYNPRQQKEEDQEDQVLSLSSWKKLWLKNDGSHPHLLKTSVSPISGPTAKKIESHIWALGDPHKAFTSLSVPLYLICGVIIYVCGHFSTPSFYHFWTQGDCSWIDARSENRTSVPVQALDHKSNSLPLGYRAWRNHL